MTNPTSVAEIRRAVLNLTHNIQGANTRAHDGNDPDMLALLNDQGGWNVVAVLKTAAVCALVQQLPITNPDVALVLAQLREYGFEKSPYAPYASDAYESSRLGM